MEELTVKDKLKLAKDLVIKSIDEGNHLTDDQL
jgi:hypothetical protein